MKKNTTGDIIILHKCTKDHDHMVYCFWNTARDRCNCYFSFWAIISPFTPQNENFKKKKKKKKKKTPRDTIILHKCTKNHDQKLYYS